MAANSAIEWTTHTFNPWWGCTKVAAGCTHCYAETLSKRLGRARWGDHGTRMLTKDWASPRKWNASAEKAGVRARVFCASMADVFEDWNGLFLDHKQNVVAETMDEVRRRLFDLIDATPWLDWLLLTKRPENIRDMTPAVKVSSQQQADDVNERGELYRRNVWLLTSVAEQKDADANVPALLKCRDLAPVLGLSCEPLIEAVKLPPQAFYRYRSQCSGLLYAHRDSAGDYDDIGGIDWVICGGESGPGARPMHPDWARGLRDRCAAAGVPFFFKQWGEWAPEQCHVVMVPKSEGGNYAVLPSGEKVHGSDPRPSHVWLDSELTPHANSDRCWSSRKVGKKAAGRLLDGVTHDAMPSLQPLTSSLS